MQIRIKCIITYILQFTGTILFVTPTSEVGCSSLEVPATSSSRSSVIPAPPATTPASLAAVTTPASSPPLI